MPEQINRDCGFNNIPLPNEPSHCNRPAQKKSVGGINSLFNRIQWDDIILLVLIIVLLTEDNVDTLLVIALFYLFVMGI